MNRILSLVAAAAIAVTTLGATAPAMAAPVAPALAQSQTADSLLVEVSKKGGKRGGFKRHGKRFGYHGYYGGYYPRGHAVSACWTTEKVWTKYGWRWQQVYNCY